MHMDQLPVAAALYVSALAFLIGTVFGSFCNAWAWRIVHHEKISHGRSHCPECGHTLAAKDLVPLFSWLFLKGKCRYCGAPIAARYPLSEAVSGLYYLSVLLVCGVSLDTLRFWALGSLLLVMSLEDLDIMEIEDGLQIAAAALFLLRFREPGFLRSALWGLSVAAGLLIFVLIAERILNREAMGGADIKMIAVFGLHFGALETLFLLIIGCFIGLAGAAVAKKGPGKEFPFGPALAAAAWVTVLAGEKIVNAYLMMF